MFGCFGIIVVILKLCTSAISVLISCAVLDQKAGLSTLYLCEISVRENIEQVHLMKAIEANVLHLGRESNTNESAKCGKT